MIRFGKVCLPWGTGCFTVPRLFLLFVFVVFLVFADVQNTWISICSINIPRRCYRSKLQCRPIDALDTPQDPTAIWGILFCQPRDRLCAVGIGSQEFLSQGSSEDITKSLVCTIELLDKEVPLWGSFEVFTSEQVIPETNKWRSLPHLARSRIFIPHDFLPIQELMQ